MTVFSNNRREEFALYTADTFVTRIRKHRTLHDWSNTNKIERGNLGKRDVRPEVELLHVESTKNLLFPTTQGSRTRRVTLSFLHSSGSE